MVAANVVSVAAFPQEESRPAREMPKANTGVVRGAL
jgi:hypothetical protein